MLQPGFRPHNRRPFSVCLTAPGGGGDGGGSRFLLRSDEVCTAELCAAAMTTGGRMAIDGRPAVVDSLFVPSARQLPSRGFTSVEAPLSATGAAAAACAANRRAQSGDAPSKRRLLIELCPPRKFGNCTSTTLTN